jgi:hypothetical protein
MWGSTKNVTDRLILGARAKIYMSSLMRLQIKIGYIYTVPAENTIYEQVISSDMQLNTSGISEYISEGYNGDAAGDIKRLYSARIWDSV